MEKSTQMPEKVFSDDSLARRFHFDFNFGNKD